MDRWAPIFNKIVESSIWDEDDSVCKVWITMLALQDSDHVVRKTAYAIGRASRKDEEEVLRAIKVLSSPDKKRREHQENEGRRVQEQEDGWLILNGQKYEELMRKVSRQAYQAKWARENRARLKAGEEKIDGFDNTGERGVGAVNQNIENGIPMRPAFEASSSRQEGSLGSKALRVALMI